MKEKILKFILNLDTDKIWKWIFYKSFYNKFWKTKIINDLDIKYFLNQQSAKTSNKWCDAILINEIANLVYKEFYLLK